MDSNELNIQIIEAYDKFSDAIFRHCYLRVSDREKARDIMQDTFTRTWQYMVGGREIKNLKAFLFRTANNLIIDEYRKKKTDSLDNLQEKGFDIAGDDANAAINAVELKNAIDLVQELDPSFRDVIILRLIDDFSPREIGEITGQTENAVSVKIHRGLKKLRELINGG